MKKTLLAVALALFPACGGSAPPAEAPKSHSVAESKGKTESHVEDEPAASRRSGVECDDGSCFTCGDAVCLAGFYCAVGKSGRGCAWLPSCPGKATCACVGAALKDEPSCGCQEREGGVYVTCDGAKL